MNSDILEMRLRGYCCSQIIMKLGLDRMGKENEDLIAAMAGLCNGLWQGKICGILSGGWTALSCWSFWNGSKVTYVLSEKGTGESCDCS